MLKYILLLSLMLTGCTAVRMNARYSALLNHTTDWSVEVAERAGDGELTKSEMIIYLDQNAQMWLLFHQARSGR